MAEVASTVTDPRAPRYRVLQIQESGDLTPELAQARANWERGNRIGKALTLKYKVQGWRQSNGALWRVNLIVRVVDYALGIDRDMLISEVQYSLDDPTSFSGDIYMVSATTTGNYAAPYWNMTRPRNIA